MMTIALFQDGYNSQSTRFAMMDTDIQDLVRILIITIAIIFTINVTVNNFYAAFKGENPQGRADDWTSGLQTFHAQQRWQVRLTKHFIFKYFDGASWAVLSIYHFYFDSSNN